MLVVPASGSCRDHKLRGEEGGSGERSSLAASVCWGPWGGGAARRGRQGGAGGEMKLNRAGQDWLPRARCAGARWGSSRIILMLLFGVESSAKDCPRR